MKNQLKLKGFIAIFLILCLAVFAFAACNKNPDPDPDGDTGDNGDQAPPVLDGDVLTLIREGKVNFRVVKTTKIGGSEAIKAVANFVEKLRALGLDVADAVADNDESAVTDCEIIIGAGAQYRGDECNVDTYELGEDGYIVKVVGARVVIAGGSDEMLVEALDKFTEQVMGITDKTTSLAAETVTVKTDKVIKQDTEYDVTDIKISDNKVSLSKYYLSYDRTDTVSGTMANTIRNAIYKASGIHLPLEHEAAEGTNITYRVIVRIVANAGEGAFKVSIDKDDNLLFECSYADGFAKGVEAFLGKYLTGKKGVVRIYNKDIFTYAVNVVRYTDFGAKGDGKTDDSLAILATHEYANQHGMKVLEDRGLTYYLGEASYGIYIPICTDVDFGKATFIVDDSKLRPDTSYGEDLGRSLPMFWVCPSAECEGYDAPRSLYASKSLYKDAVNASGNIGMTFDTDVMIGLSYTGQRQYIRWGINANNGGDTYELLIVDKDGNIDPTTPLTYDYPRIDWMAIYPINETPITIKGGKFITYANRTYFDFDAGSGYISGDQYYYYNRGMQINRSNVTVSGMEHYVEKEGATGYPYNGWFSIGSNYNTLIEDCVVTGRKAYTEDRNGVTDSGSTMGSYDLIGGSAINITFKNVKQSNSITSTYYWGIMGSNYCRNITYDGCYLSRFDAHCGVYNATLVDTTIGFDITLIGHGLVTVKNVKKLCGTSLIALRVDYGSTWRGTVVAENVTMYGYATHNKPDDISLNSVYSDFSIISGTWKDHEFGNDCDLPSIVVDGFQAGGSARTVNLSLYDYLELSVDSFTRTHKNYLALPEFVEIKSVGSNVNLYYVTKDNPGGSMNLEKFFHDGTIEDRSSAAIKAKIRYRYY